MSSATWRSRADRTKRSSTALVSGSLLGESVEARLEREHPFGHEARVRGAPRLGGVVRTATRSIVACAGIPSAPAASAGQSAIIATHSQKAPPGHATRRTASLPPPARATRTTPAIAATPPAARGPDARGGARTRGPRGAPSRTRRTHERLEVARSEPFGHFAQLLRDSPRRSARGGRSRTSAPRGRLTAARRRCPAPPPSPERPPRRPIAGRGIARMAWAHSQASMNVRRRSLRNVNHRSRSAP